MTPQNSSLNESYEYQYLADFYIYIVKYFWYTKYTKLKSKQNNLLKIILVWLKQLLD